MWPWTRRRSPKFDDGAVFRCAAVGRVVETATVLGRFVDPSGIPHIRYRLRLATPTGLFDGEEQRVLALSAFAQRYSEYCGDAQAA